MVPFKIAYLDVVVGTIVGVGLVIKVFPICLAVGHFIQRANLPIKEVKTKIVVDVKENSKMVIGIMLVGITVERTS